MPPDVAREDAEGYASNSSSRAWRTKCKKGSRNTIFGRRRTISVRRFARSCSKDEFHPVAESADKSPRKPSAAVCFRILGGENTSMTSSCKAPP